ncbi:MAG: sensor histidine kinase [Acidimicrobiales bacterium]
MSSTTGSSTTGTSTTGTSTTGRRRPFAADVALAVSLLVVAILSGRYVESWRPDTVAPASWWHWLLLATPAVLVAGRRIDPIAVVALATVAQASIWIVGLPDVLLPMIVVLYTAASEAGDRGARAAIASSVVLTVVTAVGVRITEDVTIYQLPLIALTCGTAIVLGINAARQRSAAIALAGSAAEARVRAEHEREQAISEERAHIGRELHDIIGHSLSVIAVRAEAADRVADTQPNAAREAVADIATAARSALSETRRILAGLQRSSAAELTPPPDIDATRQLVADLAGSGIDATLRQDGCDERPPSSVVAGGTYRIVQECLTNAMKHGGPEVKIDAALTCDTGGIEISVANTMTAGDAAVGARRPDAEGSGLAGMAERAEVLGGTFRAGHQADGTFLVVATIPDSSADRTEDLRR